MQLFSLCYWYIFNLRVYVKLHLHHHINTANLSQRIYKSAELPLTHVTAACEACIKDCLHSPKSHSCGPVVWTYIWPLINIKMLKSRYCGCQVLHQHPWHYGKCKCICLSLCHWHPCEACPKMLNRVKWLVCAYDGTCISGIVPDSGSEPPSPPYLTP